MTSKAAQAAQNKIVTSIKQQSSAWYVGDNTDLGGDVSKVLKSAQKIVEQTEGTCNLLLTSAGKDQLVVLTHIVNKEPFETFDTWIRYCVPEVYEVVPKEDHIHVAIIKKDTEKEIFPLKELEPIRGSAFNFLHKNKLVEEESSEEPIDFEDF
jgi:hypothetical protein